MSSSSIALPSEETTASLAALRAQRNRQNAQKSTGPRTAAGKARSAQNARTHGLTSTLAPNQLPVPDPTAQLAYTTLKQELAEEHRPTTPTQHTLLDELTLIIWKLQYIPRIEHRLLNTPLPDDRPQTPQPDPSHITPHPRLDHEADPTAAVYALHLMQDEPTALLRLHNLHHRLQARLNSILNQLRRLRVDAQLNHHDDNDRQRALRNAQTDRALAHRTAQYAAERKRDHDTLTQMNNEIRDRNRKEEEQARRDRLQALQAPVQIEPTAPALPLQHSQFSIQHSPTAPAQNEPTQTQCKTNHTPDLILPISPPIPQFSGLAPSPNLQYGDSDAAAG